MYYQRNLPQVEKMPFEKIIPRRLVHSCASCCPGFGVDFLRIFRYSRKRSTATGTLLTFPRNTVGLRLFAKKPPSKDLGGFPFTPYKIARRVQLPSNIACQEKADNRNCKYDSCCHCTPSKNGFRRFSTSVKFEEQPPVSFRISPYDCAFLIFGVSSVEF